MALTSDEREPLIRHNTTSPQDVESDSVSPKAEAGEVEGIRLYLALIFPLIGLLLCALDATMVSTVSATVAADFESLAIVSWLGSAYLVAVAAVQPISGKLTDRIGRRSGFFCALFCFGLGNLMCGVAVSEAMLVAGRVVAGTGGGAISSIGVFVTSDLLPLRKRPVWQGLGNVFWAMGMGIGGVFGGLINDTLGWRWAFNILVPCTVILGIATYFTFIRGLPRPVETGSEETQSKSIDIVGSVLLTGALVCFVLGLNFQENGKNRTLTLVLLIVAAVIFFCFLVAEIWFIPDPVVPLHLLADRSVTGACFSGFLISVSMHSLLFYVPLLIQVRGFNTRDTGLQLLGNPLGSAIGPFCTGLVLRVIGSYGIVKPIVYLFYLVGPLGFYFSDLEAPTWATIIYMACLGGGFGSVLTFNLTGLLANIDDKVQASATGMLYAFRQVGASAGLAISGIIFRAKVEKELAQSVERIPGLLIQLAASGNISRECSRQKHIGNEVPKRCEVYFDALNEVFLFTLITALAGVVFGMIIRNKSLDQDQKAVSNETREQE